MKNICVFLGGKSCEHDISIITGVLTINSIDRNLYNAIPIYIAKDGKWYTGEVLKDIGDKATNTFILSFDSKSEDEMRIRNTFVNWNFDIWGIDERIDTPYLKWEV